MSVEKASIPTKSCYEIARQAALLLCAKSSLTAIAILGAMRIRNV